MDGHFVFELLQASIFYIGKFVFACFDILTTSMLTWLVLTIEKTDSLWTHTHFFLSM